jgi:hypothetical protein
MPNPIVSLDRSGKVPVYVVKKILTNEETKAKERVFMKDADFPIVLQEDADVYTEDGELLLRFRKNVLSKQATHDAYHALKEFARHASTNRGIASGSDKGKTTGMKKPVMSNIIGYFDKWSVSQKMLFKQSGIKMPSKCRLTSFNIKSPEKWAKCLPLIKEIDEQYKRLCPKEHANQLKAAKSTPFHIKGTSFSTITTNLNFRTAAHTDSGDWPDGFGNLVVLESGAPYKGSHTGFPQYGVAVDCREGDFLAMDVHQVHGNSPFLPKDDTSMRLSLVSYLREGIVKKCRGATMYNAERLAKQLNRWRRKTQKNKEKLW